MPTTLTNGIQLPDKGSVDWYSSMQSNYNLIDTHLGDTDVHVTAEDKANWNSKQGSLSQAQLDAIAQVATNTSDIATLQSGKANASHTHSSSDITDIGDYATKQYVDNSISGLVDNAPAALDTLKELSTALNDDANFATTVTTALSAKANSADLATVATSGSYNDLSNKPTINDSTITIQKNGSTVDTFTTNGSAKTIDIPVPTKTSDLTNDSNFVDTSNSAVASGITSAKVTSYDAHIADTDIHVTTADKTKWNNGVTQSYVFRYSSTALTASSTNSNTLLDNTDNLKVGDKVIDSNGVLFSITAIDSVNSTFTVGSALVDLALDGNVVHTSGNETISGDKVFNNRLIKNIDVVLGTAPSTGKYSNIDIADNNKSGLAQIIGGVYNTGQSYARFFVQNKTADDGTGLSPTGTIRSCGFNINLPASSTSEGQGSITPRANKTTDFGLSGYQWRNVWCETLFLNGTQLDPSAFALDNAVVHLSGDETVGGQKTFANNSIIVGRNTDTSSAIQLVNSDVVGGSANGASGLEVYGSSVSTDNKIGGVTVGEYSNNGGSYATIECNRTVSDVKTSNTVRNLIRDDGSKEFSAGIDNDCKLGHPYFRWSEVYAMNYYYGANNVEFSTKFVTTDTAQTITEIKTFTNTIKSKKEIELTGKRLAYILPEFSASYSGLSLCTYDSNCAVKIGSWKVDGNDNTKHVLDTSLGYLNVSTGSVNSVNIVYLTPKNATNSKLGDSTSKWREINGLTPSSLGMPSDRSARVDISGYFTNTANGDTNTYTVPANGWIYLNLNDVVVAHCFAQTAGNLSHYGQTFARASAGQLHCLFPVRKDDVFVSQWYTTTTVTVTNAYFVPCLGNI